MNTKKGNLFIFFGAIFWSLSAPIVSGSHMPALFMSCYRSMLAGLVLLPFVRIRQFKFNRYLVIFLISYLGLCGSITVAIKNTAAPIAIGMQYASIIWIFFINYFLVDKKEKEKIPAIVLIFIGVLLFMTSGGSDGSLMGNVLSFLESIFFTGMTISSSKLEDIDPLGLTSVANIFTSIVLFILIGNQRNLIFSLHSADYLSLFVLGAIQVALGYGFYNIGLKYTSSQNASLISICEMILGPLWVFLFLHEKSDTQTLLGFSFIIIGLISCYLLPRIKTRFGEQRILKIHIHSK